MWLRAISQNVCGVGVGPTGRIHQEPFGNMHFTCVGIVTCIRATAALKVQIGKSLRKKSQKHNRARHNTPKSVSIKGRMINLQIRVSEEFTHVPFLKHASYLFSFVVMSQYSFPSVLAWQELLESPHQAEATLEGNVYIT